MKILSIGDIITLDKSYIVAGITLLKRGTKVKVIDLWPDKQIVVEEVSQITNISFPNAKIWPVSVEYFNI